MTVSRILVYCGNTPERHREAIEVAGRISALTRNKSVAQGILGFAYAKAGEREKALEIVTQLRPLVEQEHAVAFFLGLIFSTLDEKQEAMNWLERAEQARLGIVSIILAPEPSFDPLRGHPRFEALLRKLGLPPS